MDVEKQKNDDTSNIESLKRNNRLFFCGPNNCVLFNGFWTYLSTKRDY